MIYESRKDFILGPDNRVLQNKQKVLDFYRVCSLIGEGGYGVVFDGVNRKTLNRVAIKQMSKSSTQQVSRFWSEIDILKHCEHPHIGKSFGQQE